MAATSLYLHIPFCIHRCGYCDFNTYAGLNELIPAYTQALGKELEFISDSTETRIPIHTIYFGGGTPSLLSADLITEILRIVKEYYDLSPNAEISLEANPGTVTEDYFKQLKEIGVNRISLGMQTAYVGELRLLERQHTYEDVVSAVEWARAAGINNLNLDLIFGLPYQTLEAWQLSLVNAVSLKPEHLSLYALTLEHGTPMQHQVESGALPAPDEDVMADMYEASRQWLREAGFIHYEISNWAHIDQTGEPYTCKHNLQYWRSLPYIGVGAGAHGFVDHYRTVNISTPRAYIKRMDIQHQPARETAKFPKTPATIQMRHITPETEIGEFMMMGLRLVNEGVSDQEFLRRVGLSLHDKFSQQIDRLVSLGLLECIGAPGETLRLTQKGQLLGNQVFKEFI